MRLTRLLSLALIAFVSLSSAADGVALFNGKDLSGWTHYLWNREAKAQDTSTPSISM